jgi:hypothetical protein
MVNFLLNYVTLIHPRHIDLLFFGKKGNPLKWKNGSLGKEDGSSSSGSRSNTSTLLDDPIFQAVGMKNDVFKELPNICNTPKSSIKINLSKYDYKKRLCDKQIWPKSNSKKMGIKTFALHFLTSTPLVCGLRVDVILPLLTFPTSKSGSTDIPFGPHLCTIQFHQEHVCYRQQSINDSECLFIHHRTARVCQRYYL